MTYDVGFYKHRVKVEHVNFVLDTQFFTFSFILLNDRIVFNAVSAKFHSGNGGFSSKEHGRQQKHNNKVLNFHNNFWYRPLFTCVK